MTTIPAIQRNLRRKGNTGLLLQKAVQGDREAGAEVEEIVLRDLKMSPRLEIYRGLDFEGDVLKHPEHLEEDCAAGRNLVEALRPKTQV